MTDNFLHNLRNQGNKRFDRNRNKQFDNQFRPNDRFAGRDRKGSPQRKPPDADQLTAIKRLLDGVLEQQRRLVDAGERAAKAAERQAEAIEQIARHFESADKIGALPAPEVPDAVGEPQVAVSEPVAPAPVEIQEGAPGDARPRQAAMELILAQRALGQSFEQIAEQLNVLDIPTVSGKGRWRAQSVSRLYNTLAEADAAPAN